METANNTADTHSKSIEPGLLLKILAGILAVMTPVGFIIMFTELGSSYLWTTTIFLGLEALIMFILLIKLADLLSVVITTAVIFMASWFVEYWGVKTGLPFGSYAYTHVLLPQVGGVPLAIMFAWFTVTASSLLTARLLVKQKNEFTAVIIASVFILATDILLEPFASFVNNFWVWQNGSIPLQNFISWLAIGLLFSVTLSQLVKWEAAELKGSLMKWLPGLIIVINIINFSVVNFAHGFHILSVTGMIIFAVMAITAFFLSKAPVQSAPADKEAV